MPKRHWLMKSEPDAFSIADLARVRVEPWTGVRNYMARNYMRAMSVGDEVLFHHSNATPPGVAGVARVVRTGVVDETQFDPASPYFDPKATRAKFQWDCVEVAYVETLPHLVSMDRLRADPALADMMVLKKGMRLSVQPVTEAEFARVVELGRTPPGDAAVAPPAGKAAAGKAAAGKAAAGKAAAGKAAPGKAAPGKAAPGKAARTPPTRPGPARAGAGKAAPRGRA